VPDVTLEQLWKGVLATSLAEWLAVATGLVYILLIILRNRWGWAAGGVSSLILGVLAARSSLPMQAALQFFYVAAALYGWWSWSPDAAQQKVGHWHWRGHLVALLASVLVSLGLAQLLAREGYSAFPFLDSLVACAGLFTTWLVARVYLENWVYWIVIDAVSIYLFVAQGLYVTALLFCLYLVIAAFGLRSWWRLKGQAAPAA
jgi:nicotinamide mononucleotide transporter